MPWIRSIKPCFFRDHRLFLLEQASGYPIRVAFAGLWTVADREGRFRWDPVEIKLDCLPYDQVDFRLVLEVLHSDRFVDRYIVAGRPYGHIHGFAVHQRVPVREAQSVIPDAPLTCTAVDHKLRCDCTAVALQLQCSTVPALCSSMIQPYAVQLQCNDTAGAPQMLRGREYEYEYEKNILSRDSTPESGPSTAVDSTPPAPESITEESIPEEKDAILNEAALAMVREFREDYRDNVDHDYKFPPRPTAIEMGAAKKFLRAKDWPQERIYELRCAVMLDQHEPRGGTNWKGWAFQVRSIAKLWAKREELEAQLVRGK